MEQPGLNPILKPFLSGWLVVEQSGHFLDENQKLFFKSRKIRFVWMIIRQ